MITEMAQVSRFLAAHHGLRLENPQSDWLVRVVDPVPDGEHTIPLGVSLTPTRVVVKDGLVYVDPSPGAVPP